MKRLLQKSRIAGLASGALWCSNRSSGSLQPAAPNCYYVGEKEDTTEEMIRNAKFVDVDPEKIRQLAKEAVASHAHRGDGCCGGGDDHLSHAKSVGSLPPAQRLTRPESTLSAAERKRLSKMIYDKHYRSEVSDGAEGVKAMMYQAALEVKFIEDFVETEYEASNSGSSTGEAMTRDDVRLLIKKHVIERCDLHKPLSYIIGHQPFYGCTIDCAPPLLCPRPETEMWCHWLVTKHHLDKATSPFLVLDMCCGTGCIGIAVAKHATMASVTALDILPEAVQVSNKNARQNGVADRYAAHESDMFAWIQSRSSAQKGALRFDILVSNPPYILPEQYVNLPATITHWESKYALVGDPTREARQYLYFQELCELGAKHTTPAESRAAEIREAPSIVVEIGLQGDRVASIMDRHPAWCDVELHTDFAGQPRWISARRTSEVSW